MRQRFNDQVERELREARIHLNKVILAKAELIDRMFDIKETYADNARIRILLEDETIRKINKHERWHDSVERTERRLREELVNLKQERR